MFVFTYEWNLLTTMVVNQDLVTPASNRNVSIGSLQQSSPAMIVEGNGLCWSTAGLRLVEELWKKSRKVEKHTARSTHEQTCREYPDVRGSC